MKKNQKGHKSKRFSSTLIHSIKIHKNRNKNVQNPLREKSFKIKFVSANRFYRKQLSNASRETISPSNFQKLIMFCTTSTLNYFNKLAIIKFQLSDSNRFSLSRSMCNKVFPSEHGTFRSPFPLAFAADLLPDQFYCSLSFSEEKQRKAKRKK